MKNLENNQQVRIDMSFCADTIFLDPRELKSNPLRYPPCEPSGKQGFIKHVNCDGARFHVISWGLDNDGKVVERCSEPNCIINSK